MPWGLSIQKPDLNHPLSILLRDTSAKGPDLLALASFLLGPGNATMEYLSLAAAWSAEHCGCASGVLPEMPVPCGKCDPSIRLCAKLETCHSSSPSDCICLKPKWNFKWIPQRILFPALPSLLLNRIPVRCPSCPFPCSRGRGMPGGATVHNIHCENGISLQEVSPTPDFCGSPELCDEIPAVPKCPPWMGEVPPSCLSSAGSRTGPAQQGQHQDMHGPLPSPPHALAFRNRTSVGCRGSTGAVDCSRGSATSETLPCPALPCQGGSAPLPHRRCSHCASCLFCRVWHLMCCC